MENLFAERLKELRLSKGLTQVQMAQLLDIAERNYQRFEGTKLILPKSEFLIFIADLFDVSIDYLVGRTDNPKVNK